MTCRETKDDHEYHEKPRIDKVSTNKNNGAVINEWVCEACLHTWVEVNDGQGT